MQVGITELHERLGTSEIGFSVRQVAQESMNENGQMIFEISRQAEEELCIASWARWNAQLKGLVEMERRCRDTRQEIQALSGRQEIFKSMMGDKAQVAGQSKRKISGPDL